jgi:hypothetical protein
VRPSAHWQAVDAAQRSARWLAEPAASYTIVSRATAKDFLNKQ